MKQHNARRPSSAPLVFALALVGALGPSGCRHRTQPHAPVFVLADSGTPSVPPARPAGPPELALLAPLVVGASLEDWTVARIEAVHLGNLQLRVEHGDRHLELNVSLANPNAPPPPAGAGRYAIYYSTRVNDLQPDGVRLATALGVVIQHNLAVPVPPGLEVFPLAAAVDAH